MATMFLAIGSAVSSAAASAASFLGFGTGAATAAGAGAAAQGAGALTLSKVMTAGSALASIGQGFAAKGQAEGEAAWARTQAAQEEAQGEAQARGLSRQYAELRAEQDAIQLANGLDIGTGTAANIREATARQADRELDVTRKNASNRASMARLRSRSLLSEGRMAMAGGMVQGAKTALSGYELVG